MGIRSRLVGTTLSVAMLALSSGTALAVSNFGNGITVGKQADFSTKINLQGNTLDFNKGTSKIYDDMHLHIVTDDFLYLDSPTATFVKSDLVVGNVLAINDNVGGRTTGSRIYDNWDLHIKTDDNLYLDAPTSTYVQNAMVVGGSLTVNGLLALPVGSITSSNILNGTILTVDLADSSVTSTKILDGTIVNADLAVGSYTGITTVGTLSDLTVTNPIAGSITGNAATASALAANGANCSAGSAPLGVDASGAAEGCTAYLGSALTSGRIFVGNGSNVATGVVVSGDATISNSGVVTVNSGLHAYGMFYGLTAGTGMAGTDYASTVAVGAAVPFPQNGPALGGIVALTSTTFKIPTIGTYEVVFNVHTTEPGQLELSVDNGAGFVVAHECTGENMNPTSGGHSIIANCIITTTGTDAVVKVINPAGNSTALTITPADGANTHANAQSLVIKKL